MLILGSAGAGSSAVVGPTPTDPVEFYTCAQELKALSAAKEHTNEERGCGGDPGVQATILPSRPVVMMASFAGS